ncbi:hypothetical protein Mucpa_0964 [Mucilaginibacter paludis DSM 18603]|uniref:Uncharacterized protein n=2 Tax=Mucilaginibacter TaxID=423349 RepID=H1YCW8_9SPHI|nr:hypothetical protein Mucpa_0964 [Mucilaginibacter paludis DSM 18603]
MIRLPEPGETEKPGGEAYQRFIQALNSGVRTLLIRMRSVGSGLHPCNTTVVDDKLGEICVSIRVPVLTKKAPSKAQKNK